MFESTIQTSGGFAYGHRALAASPLRLHRGINLNPWFSLTREHAESPNIYDWPPFQAARPVPRTGDLARLFQAGFDFVRLPVDPGPFLLFDGPRLTALLDSVAQAVDLALGAGLSVVLNMQPNEATAFWNPARMVASRAAPAYPGFRALAVRFARMLSARAVDRVALEPMNEPPGACDAGSWAPVQDDLLRTIRAAAPSLTLVATGPCGSLVQGLPFLDAGSLAGLAPLMFTVHFYEPYLFSHQGATWMSEPMYRWLTGVPWPASAGTLQGTLARVRARMDADRTVTGARKQEVWTLINAKLGEYFDADPDQGFIDRYIGQIVAWASRNGVAPSQVLIGEMGALKTGLGYVAADPADRARYIAAVRQSAEAAGLPWAIWNAFGGFGLLDDATHAFDPQIVAALGLKTPS